MEHLGTGWGKLLLFGEHAAVYGHPAVGLSLDTTLSVRLHTESLPGWKIDGVAAGDRQKILEVLDLLEDLSAQESEQRRGGGILWLESRIPRGLGFGSSASLCVAMAAAVASWRGVEDRRRIWEWAHRGEELFHGTPSGIDTGLALLRGLYSFHPHPPRLPEAEKLRGMPLHMVVGAVPRVRSAGALIGTLREKMAAGEKEVRAILQQLGALAAEAADILDGCRNQGAEDAVTLGGLAREAHQLLSRLGLSTPELDRLLGEGRRRGALGGKLSGAGGGGAFFLICPGSETAGSVAAALVQLSRSWKLDTATTIYAYTWSPIANPTSPPS
ncbi:MAG: mevalonate kinase [Spirochaetaceae bacterium]|nr:MAG: mevalonate kinase [Spirochaetaceae bacterium]